MFKRKILHEADCRHLVDMPPERGMIQYQWEVTEDIQDDQPYLEWGWWGFIPMVLLRS